MILMNVINLLRWLRRQPRRVRVLNREAILLFKVSGLNEV